LKNIISIDLGSNSFRVLSYDCQNNIGLEDFETSVGTADGLEQSGKISNEAVERIENAINLSIKKLDYDSKKAIAKTTQAMRKASNSSEVIKYIKEKTGVSFEIIEADEEARLTLLAIEYALKRENLNNKRFILVDIGGGSTELIIKNQDKVYKKSFPIGIVTLSQTKNKDIILEDYRKLMQKFIDDLKLDLSKFDFIATAGTPTTLAALKLGMNYKTYNKNKVNNTNVTLDDIDKYLEIFQNNSSEYLENLLGAGKEDYIITGVNIFKTIYQILDKKESIVFDDGLREGICIDSILKYNNYYKLTE
jgi:exopolyphosphatase / guanosine-5'-triphosphate,3'-diphosphate pyrophosphatase